jgi:hypothetical protein
VGKKVAQNLDIFQKLLKVNDRLISEKSSNLVTLSEEMSFGVAQAQKTVR